MDSSTCERAIVVPKLEISDSLGPKVLNNVSHIVVPLSQHKQGKIMRSVGGQYDSNFPYPLWNLLGQAVSEAIFGKDLLRWKTMMPLAKHEYLLFETAAAPCPLRTVLEVFIGAHTCDDSWKAYFQVARPIVLSRVEASECPSCEISKSNTHSCQVYDLL